jgi:NTP-dependent ternary system trypsin peptidase co-occuring protein
MTWWTDSGTAATAIGGRGGMIELAEVLSELRAELDRARLEAEGSALRFGLGPVELEVTLALGREGTAGGKVKFWVAEVNAEGKLSATSTQRIKLTLNPTLNAASGEDARPAGLRAGVYVGGDAVSGER